MARDERVSVQHLSSLDTDTLPINSPQSMATIAEEYRPKDTDAYAIRLKEATLSGCPGPASGSAIIDFYKIVETLT